MPLIFHNSETYQNNVHPKNLHTQLQLSAGPFVRRTESSLITPLFT